MKSSTILIVLVSLCYGCSINTNTTTDISGTYVTHFKNEYNITDDTLIVTAYSVNNNLYNVKSNTGFYKIRNGSVQPKQFQTEQIKVKWDAKNQVLTEGELGRQIHFISKKSVMLIGNTEYRKIK